MHLFTKIEENLKSININNESKTNKTISVHSQGSSKKHKKRIIGLDLLRGLAIIFVLFRHSNLDNNIVKNFGWLGVDLFFVLSGFLVSGLLFKEYKKSGKVNGIRFLVRRGFKIYPLFYMFLFTSVAIQYIQTNTFNDYTRIIIEAVYLQSYLPGIWIHTWSLAIEEHFYIGLALFIFIAIKIKILPLKRTMITFLLLLLIISFFMRLFVSYPHRNEEVFGFVQTHLRSDGIIVGVLISYLFHFTNFYRTFINWEKTFFIIAIVLILPGFYFRGGSFFMNTVGLSTVNIGFGIITLLSLKHTPLSGQFIHLLIKVPIKFLCFIGIHSYAIYLWHLTALDVIEKFDINTELAFILFVTLAITFGVVLSYTVEKPFLKIREVIAK